MSEGSEALIGWCGLARAHALPPDQAMESLDETIALARSRGLWPVVAQGLRLQAQCALALGRPDPARAALTEAGPLARALGMAGEAAEIDRVSANIS